MDTHIGKYWTGEHRLFVNTSISCILCFSRKKKDVSRRGGRAEKWEPEHKIRNTYWQQFQNK